MRDTIFRLNLEGIKTETGEPQIRLADGEFTLKTGPLEVGINGSIGATSSLGFYVQKDKSFEKFESSFRVSAHGVWTRVATSVSVPNPEHGVWEERNDFCNEAFDARLAKGVTTEENRESKVAACSGQEPTATLEELQESPELGGQLSAQLAFTVPLFDGFIEFVPEANFVHQVFSEGRTFTTAQANLAFAKPLGDHFSITVGGSYFYDLPSRAGEWGWVVGLAVEGKGSL